MRTVLRAYEPVFGGIVAILAAALLCFVLIMPSDQGSHTGRMSLLAYSGMGISWGLLQIAGYRTAKRKGIKLEEPTLDTALGCVLLGLMFALVTVFFFALAHSIWYPIAMGTAAVLLLAIGAIVGIRKGTWRS
jgi:hypothetical protein